MAVVPGEPQWFMLHACTQQAPSIEHASSSPTLKDLGLLYDHEQLIWAFSAFVPCFTCLNSIAAVLVL